ncbi:MAG: ribonuclease HI [Pirellulales bacterium]
MPDAAPDADAEAALPHVLLYTDGGCGGNPGPGGWAFILKHPATGKEMEKAGAEPHTTNNRMELQAVIEGLASLKKPSLVDLYTDSEYVRMGLSQWMAGWKRNGWQRKERGANKEVKNVELWQRLDELVAQHQIRFHRVAGHSGHPENDRCDELAVDAYRRLR